MNKNTHRQIPPHKPLSQNEHTDEHTDEHLSLDDICGLFEVGLSKGLRAQHGVNSVMKSDRGGGDGPKSGT